MYAGWGTVVITCLINFEMKQLCIFLQGTSHKCNVCHQSFSTRNKLFGHIKSTGHALHVNAAPAEAEEGKRGKKGKKKGKRWQPQRE